MPPPLAGRTIALAEGRQLEELVALLEREGAAPLRYPLLSILDAPDPAPVLAWIDALCAGAFGLVVLMTGEAVARLAALAERHGLRERFVEALGRTRTLTRGPKPGRALKDLGLAASRVAPAPTTAGVIEALASESVAGTTVGVTLYNGPNPPLELALTSAGASVRTVQPYVYAPLSDDERVGDLIDRLAAGSLDALVFTSSPQVERLFEVAERRGGAAQLHDALGRTCVAAVGPLVADELRRRDVAVQVCPEQGWVMKNLVQQLRRHLTGAG